MKKIFALLIIFFEVFNLFSEENQKHFFKIPKETSIFAIDDGSLLSFGYDVYYGNYMEVDYYNLGIIVKYCNLGKMRYFFDKKNK